MWIPPTSATAQIPGEVEAPANTSRPQWFVPVSVLELGRIQNVIGIYEIRSSMLLLIRWIIFMNSYLVGISYGVVITKH